MAVFEEGPADLFRLFPQSIIKVFVLIEGKGGFVVSLCESLFGADGSSVVEGATLTSIIVVFVGRVICVFGVFAENGLVAISRLVVSLSLLLLERLRGSIEAGLGLAAELAQLGMQLIPHCVESHPVALQLRLELYSTI